MLVTLIATSMAVVRERELGTLEQLVVTPVSRGALVAGKLIPFAIFGFADSLLVLAIARFWFDIPLEGSGALLVASVFPFLLSTLGLGLILSTVSRTQQQAMMTAVFFVMLPMIYLSGFVFPIESMPAAVQPLTRLVPLRHFLEIVRAVMLKGAGISDLAPQLLQMTALGFAIFGAAVLLFRKRID
jgi:ABC-2 type transport system permease protein